MSRNKNNNELEGIKKIAETDEAFEFASSVFYELKEALFGEKIQFGNIGRNNVREAATDYVFKRLNELLWVKE